MKVTGKDSLGDAQQIVIILSSMTEKVLRYTTHSHYLNMKLNQLLKLSRSILIQGKILCTRGLKSLIQNKNQINQLMTTY